MKLIWQISERLTALVILCTSFAIFDVRSEKLIDIIIIAQDSNRIIVFPLAKQFFRTLKKTVQKCKAAFMFCQKLRRNVSLKKKIFSSGVVGLVGFLLQKPIRSLEAMISRETFRRYLTSR